MKIRDVLGNPIISTSKSKPDKTDDAAPFSEILAAAEESKNVSPAVDPRGLEPVLHIEQSMMILPDLKFQGLTKGEELISVLERYCRALADPSRSLRDLGHDIASLEKKMEELLPIAKSLSPGDPLKGILNELAITAKVESIKFERGEYL
ncbi:MAG: hypothetical protein V1736_03450 [Pseudomonadota bacterium]